MMGIDTRYWEQKSDHTRPCHHSDRHAGSTSNFAQSSSVSRSEENQKGKRIFHKMK